MLLGLERSLSPTVMDVSTGILAPVALVVDPQNLERELIDERISIRSDVLL